MRRYIHDLHTNKVYRKSTSTIDTPSIHPTHLLHPIAPLNMSGKGLGTIRVRQACCHLQVSATICPCTYGKPCS